MSRRSKYISIKDPALDTEHKDFEAGWSEFRRTGDPAHALLKPGQTPVVYTLERLSMESWELAMGFERSTTQQIWLVAFSLRAVDGHGDPDLQKLALTKIRGVGEHVKLEQIKLLFRPSLVNELAARVLELSELDPFPGPA